MASFGGALSRRRHFIASDSGQKVVVSLGEVDDMDDCESRDECLFVCGLNAAAMKADRKRLTSEKADLVSQMKQLYSTLKDKESELRDFIRNYEQRTNHNNQLIKQVR